MKPYNSLTKHIFRILFIVATVLVTTMTNCYGQSLSQKDVDISTYNLYMTGDWNALVEQGNKAIDDGIDYFYLRMRIAYAYYMQAKYRQAIPHYKKALIFNPDDANAQYFLIHCYEYSGRDNEALKFSSRISDKTLPDIANKYKNKVLKAGIVYSYSTGNNEDAINSISTGNDLSVYGIQKASNYFKNTTAILSHKIGRSIIVNHSLDYLHKSDYNYLTGDGVFIENTDQALNQWIYSFNLDINPIGGFTINPGINYLNIYVPIEDSGVDNYTDKTWLYNMKLQQELNKVKLGASIFGGELNDINILQLGVHLTWYPKANLNLYYALDGYWQEQKAEQSTENNFIHKHTLGLKVTNYWWTEVSVLFPEVINFYDFSNGALYNSLEGTKSALSLTNIFLIKNSKLSFIAGASMNKGVSSFIPSDEPLSRSNTTTYNRLIFTGGIIWKL